MDSNDAVNVSATVVKAVAETTETDALSLDPPLSSVVDGDALEALAGSARIEFEYCDRDVVVRTDSTVTVDGTEYGERGGTRGR